MVPALSEIVEHYWYSKIELSASVVQHYAKPLLQGLVFNFRQHPEEHTFNGKTAILNKTAYILGQSLSPRLVRTHENGVDILGVKFTPLGITRLTGINMRHIADKIINAEDIWGSEMHLL